MKTFKFKAIEEHHKKVLKCTEETSHKIRKGYQKIVNEMRASSNPAYERYEKLINEMASHLLEIQRVKRNSFIAKGTLFILALTFIFAVYVHFSGPSN